MEMDDEINTAAEVAEGAAMPRQHEVHTDPEQQKAHNPPLPKGMTAQPVAQKSPAQWAYERVVLYLQKFEEQLDNEHEVAMGFAATEAGVLRIEGMGYFDPDIVTFYGTDGGGGRTQLIQHVSQLNVMLRALPKEVQDAAPRRIGFRLAQDLESNESAT